MTAEKIPSDTNSSDLGTPSERSENVDEARALLLLVNTTQFGFELNL